MSTLATSCLVIVAVLSGIILLGSVSPVSAYRSLSFERQIGSDFITFSPSAVENTTVYYGMCSEKGSFEVMTRQDCVLYRVKADFSGGSPKEDKCNFTMQSEFGGPIVMGLSRIDQLGRDRAIVRWAEDTKEHNVYILRLSVVDFSNCKVTTTKISQDLDRLMKNKIFIRLSGSVDGFYTIGYDGYFPSKTDYNWPMYQKGEDDFDIVSIVYGTKSLPNNSVDDYVEVLRASIDADGVASKVGTLLPPTFSPLSLLIFPLSKDQGYLYIANESQEFRVRSTMAVALIQPNGQRRNLTRVQDVYPVGTASVSLANGMIGICARQNMTTMQCTQFRLDDQNIEWLPVSLMEDRRVINGVRREIYNLPRGEGFLTKIVSNFFPLTDKYLLKIGLDGKVKQFLDPDMYCPPYRVAAAFNKIFEDDRGNYCVTTTCLPFFEEPYYGRLSYYVKLQSKCFEPEDFKNVSKYETIAEYESGYPRKGEELTDGLIKYELLIE